MQLLVTCVFCSTICCRNLDNKERRQKKAYEMRCHRNMLDISWRDKVSSDIIRQNVDRKETIMDIIRCKKLILFGLICHMVDDRLIGSAAC